MEQNENRVLYDWLTFTTKIHSLPDVIDLLGLQKINFQQMRGRYCYQDRLNYDGINIMYNGREEMGICVELSGQGCRDFETYGNGDYKGIFELISSNWNENSEKKDMSITRLDVAYDDYIGLLDLNYLMSAVRKGEYVSRLKRAGVNWDNTDGCTVYHGSKHQSEFYIRIYDKLIEQTVIKKRDIDKSIKHWVRCEIQMRDDCARGFIKLSNDIRKNYFDVLNNYLRYVVPSDNSSNKRMVATSPEWLSFIESWESVSVFDKPGVNYNFSNLFGYVNNQLSGAIATYIDVLGVTQFMQNINRAQKEKPLNPKYERIRAQNESSSDGILNFLHERGAI